MQRLLVSIRGKTEAVEAVRGGAHIVDVEFPASALGTPYPLNIKSVRQAVPLSVKVSTNIGEMQSNRATACQAAVGVAIAGADMVKAGLAKMRPPEATYLGRSIVRSVREFGLGKQVILAFFVDRSLRQYLDPLDKSVGICAVTGADGTLLDTFEKGIGKGLLDYCSAREIERFVAACHLEGVEAWVAGSITLSQLPPLWDAGVDVVCVRQAACSQSKKEGRLGRISHDLVRRLVGTLPPLR